MGGGVKVVIRQEDGSIVKMCRWTNNLGWWLYRPEFITDPSKVLNDYIKEKDKSSYYTPNATLAPDGYGLIVIDQVSKTILSHQDYCGLGQLHGARVMLDLKIYDTLNWKLVESEIPFISLKKFTKKVEKTNESFADFGLNSEVDEELATMKRTYDLFMMGAVTADKNILQSLENHEKKKVFKSKQLKNYRKLAKRFGSQEKRTVDDWKYFLEFIKNRKNMDFFEVKLGFDVIDFRQDLDNVTEYDNFLEKLIELDFKITKRDIKEWDEFLESYKED